MTLRRLLGTGPAGGPRSGSKLRAAKRRVVPPLTNRVVNPLVRPLLARGLPDRGWADARVRVAGRWREGRAQVLAADDPYARLRALKRPLNDAMLLIVGTEQLVVRIDLDPPGAWTSRPAPPGRRAAAR